MLPSFPRDLGASGLELLGGGDRLHVATRPHDAARVLDDPETLHNLDHFRRELLALFR